MPLAENEDGIYLTKDLIKELNIPVLIVTHPSLGTINHSLLPAEYAKKNGIAVLGFIINNMSQEESLMEQDNVRMIEILSGVPVIGKIPYSKGKYESLLNNEPLIPLNQILKKQRQNH